MTLFDNDTSHSNEATATLTAPEGSTSTNHTEPEAAHAEPTNQAADSGQNDATSAAPSTVLNTTETEAKADAPAARRAIELPAHEEAAAEDFATALENYENAAAAEPEESAADRLSKGTVVKITHTHADVEFVAKCQ